MVFVKAHAIYLLYPTDVCITHILSKYTGSVNLLWITCVWNYFSKNSTSEEGSFIFIFYKIEVYCWPVHQ